MNDFPTQIADFLEETAGKIRSMTVDRLASAAKWTGVGIVAAMLGFSSSSSSWLVSYACWPVWWACSGPTRSLGDYLWSSGCSYGGCAFRATPHRTEDSDTQRIE